MMQWMHDLSSPICIKVLIMRAEERVRCAGMFLTMTAVVIEVVAVQHKQAAYHLKAS